VGARGDHPDRPRHRPHARLRGPGHQGHGQRAGAPRVAELGYGMVLATPTTVSGPRSRADRPLRRAAPLHGVGSSDRHRLRRLPGLLDGPRHGGRRDKGPPARAAAGGRERAGKVLAIEEDGVRFRSHLDGSEKPLRPETSMEVQAALGGDIALVSTSARPSTAIASTPRAPRAHPPLAGALPALARRRLPGRRLGGDLPRHRVGHRRPGRAVRSSSAPPAGHR